ncbi:MAG: hypothetical protein ACUVWN_15385, partial [bacterium]
MIKKFFVIIFFLLLSCNIGLGRDLSSIPIQEYTIWGKAFVNERQLTNKDTEYVISIKTNNKELASYAIGSEPKIGDSYLLKIPMKVGDRKPNEKLYMYINNKPISSAFLEPSHQEIILPFTIGNPGETIRLDIIAFIDKSPPYILNQKPEPYSTALPDTKIYLEIKDDESGVDINTILMEVNGISVIPEITPIENGYSLTYHHFERFYIGQNVNVTISACDKADPPNEIFPKYSYYFTVKNTPPMTSNLIIIPTSPKSSDRLI